MDYITIFEEYKILRGDGSINKGALDRYILAKHDALRNMIYDATSFLDETVNTSYDRVYSLLHKLSEPKRCNYCNTQIRLTSKRNYCSISCFNKCPEISKKRIETLSKIDPETGISKAKYIGIKAGKTKNAIDENGMSISKSAGIKISKAVLMIDTETGLSIAKIRGGKVSETLNKINDVTGKSIAQEKGENLSILLNTVNADGITESARRSKLALETMKSSVDPITGLNLSQLKSYKLALTKEANGKAISFLGGRKDCFKTYRSMVLSYTFQNNLFMLENFSKRANHATNKLAYHIDHKFSVLEGFKAGIDPKIIGSLCNLQMIGRLDNIKKGSTCSISKEQLLSDYKKVGIDF